MKCLALAVALVLAGADAFSSRASPAALSSRVLPPSRREIVQMRGLFGKTDAEIAADEEAMKGMSEVRSAPAWDSGKG